MALFNTNNVINSASKAENKISQDKKEFKSWKYVQDIADFYNAFHGDGNAYERAEQIGKVIAMLFA